MTTFQQNTLLLAAIWLVTIVAWSRRSSIVLIGGLFAIAAYALMSLARARVMPAELGLAIPASWRLTIGLGVAWLGLMLAYSPTADKLAGRWFQNPPALEAFRTIQESTGRLIAGIVLAWVLGGVLEEFVARGIVLKSLEALLSSWLGEPVAAGIAICFAGIGAGLMHLYQGPRAVLIITQLSILFGLLFVMGGYNLWAVMLCHGLYDTIAFVRFARKRSRYSHLGQDNASS